jgi:class 3 adenylate cyclase
MAPNEQGLRFRGLPITGIITLAVGGIVAIVVAVVLIVSYSIAKRNTIELLQERTRLTIGALAARTRDHLNPVHIQVEFLANLLSTNTDVTNNQNTLKNILHSSLAGLNQVSSVAFINRDLRAVRAFRHRPEQPTAVSDWSQDVATKRILKEQMGQTKASWGGFFVAEPVGEAFINVYSPVRGENGYLGFLVAGVSIRELSKFITKITDEETISPFILYGRDLVVAHPAMLTGANQFSGISDAQPLPLLKDFDDPILRSIWSNNRDRSLEQNFGAGAGVRAVRFMDETYIFTFQELQGFGDNQLIVGAYIPLEDAAQQLMRTRLIPIVGFAALFCALAVAVILGRALSGPMRGLATTASHIRRLDIDGAPTLSKGFIRELNEIVNAFNAMVIALRAFETYVPRFLVTRLIDYHGGKEIVSENREITVLFTDIVGFTQKAENMPPRELAAFLNHHFDIVSREVEAEHGTIDKYIGDAVMAFWGAPEPQPDQALRACRAAAAIAKSLHADNVERRIAGLEPVHIRMGIHKGKAMVGNIGGSNRVNYTVVGDTVNVAERIESMSRNLIDPDHEAGLLISDEVAALVDDCFQLRVVDRCQLKGKSEPVALHEVLDISSSSP